MFELLLWPTFLKAEFHEHLTCPGIKHDQEMSICLLKSDLKTTKSISRNCGKL